MIENKSNSVWKLTGITFFLLLLDQGSKWFIEANLSPGSIKQVIPQFFDLTLTYNYGVAFGFLSNLPQPYGNLALLITTICVSGIIARLALTSTNPANFISFAMMFGGALSNAIDRLRISAVVDWLRFHFAGKYYYPNFNFADSFIVIGVLILILKEFIVPKLSNKPIQSLLKQGQR